ncbi:uncharacterized [Tachysurus ichikawai]
MSRLDIWDKSDLQTRPADGPQTRHSVKGEQAAPSSAWKRGMYLGLGWSQESLMSCGADAAAGFPPDEQASVRYYCVSLLWARRSSHVRFSLHLAAVSHDSASELTTKTLYYPVSSSSSSSSSSLTHGIPNEMCHFHVDDTTSPHACSSKL